jgi:hypothetical protein
VIGGFKQSTAFQSSGLLRIIYGTENKNVGSKEVKDMYYHAIAVLPGARQKSIVNKTEEKIFAEIVLPYFSSGFIEAKWGKKAQSYQVLELRIYKTKNAWSAKAGIKLEKFLQKSRNIYSNFEKKAQKALGKTVHRVFVIMPIQGEKFGSQDEQRIYREFDERFEVLERVLGEYRCGAIRIDKDNAVDLRPLVSPFAVAAFGSAREFAT